MTHQVSRWHFLSVLKSGLILMTFNGCVWRDHWFLWNSWNLLCRKLSDKRVTCVYIAVLMHEKLPVHSLHGIQSHLVVPLNCGKIRVLFIMKKTFCLCTVCFFWVSIQGKCAVKRQLNPSWTTPACASVPCLTTPASQNTRRKWVVLISAHNFCIFPQISSKFCVYAAYIMGYLYVKKIVLLWKQLSTIFERGTLTAST